MRASNKNSPLVSAIADAIRRVPRGRVSTYGAIAKAAGYPRCGRHVARVLNQVQGLPWQRIVGSGGSISLRGEAALEQRFLLEAEGVRFRGRKADLRQFEHHFSKPAVRNSASKTVKAVEKKRVPAKTRLRPKW